MASFVRYPAGACTTFVGIYGCGKTLYADDIASEAIRRGARVVRLNFKYSPAVDHRALLKIMGQSLGENREITTDFDLHYALLSFVDRVAPSPVVLVVEEVQHLLSLSPSFFDALEAVRYLRNPNLTIVLFGQPQIRSTVNEGFLRLTKGKYIPVPARLSDTKAHAFLKAEERRLQYPVSSWKKSIFRFSNQHYGSIRYICQMLQKKRSAKQRLTGKQVIEWAGADPQFPYFLHQVWDSLTESERLLVRELLVTGVLSCSSQKTVSYQSLIQLGVFRVVHGNVQFLLPLYASFILRLPSNAPSGSSDPISYRDGMVYIFGNRASSLLTHQEEMALTALVSSSTVVSFDALANAMWGSTHSERFSLWSIAKVIERVRKKLSSVGIPSAVVRSVSKIGYQYQRV